MTGAMTGAMTGGVIGVERLARIRLNARWPLELADFYGRALGFARLPATEAVGEDAPLRLALGASRLDIAAAGPDAAAYPEDVPGNSPLFQHFALITADIGAAFERLRATHGWRPISEDGPQRLPASSGGVTAFKFRDPEGHPVELIEFPDPDSNTARIDHSAISVADTERGIGFYRALGLRVSGGSSNHGPEQARLDGLPGARVRVTALAPPRAPTPHVELLGYAQPPPRADAPARVGDVAATRLVFEVAAAETLMELWGALRSHAAAEASFPEAVLLRDPDGHLVELELAPQA